jgi:hypothetical protein
MKTEKEKLEKQLSKVQKEIDKLGIVSTLELGWQTQRFARASRKLDYLSMEKFEILKKLETLN